MAIEIGPFFVYCTECDHEVAINSYSARSPEAMVIFADGVRIKHRCRAKQAKPPSDRWAELLAPYENELKTRH